MLVPLSWLREYVDIPVDVRRLAHDLTMSGTKIEAIHGGAPDFEGVFIGKVLQAGRHPSADRLSLCTVEVGGEELSIVCGAQNVRAGLTVAVAKVGARLPGGVKIRKSKIRGETSEGMICSSRELGLGDEASGIMELDSSLVSGTDYAAHAGGGDVVLEAEITPNRPDCLSILGMAREVGALYQVPVRPPRVKLPAADRDAPVPVEIAAAEDCRRYVACAVRGVRIGPSPEWLQARLRAIGAHPINNVVDITNFVLFETGQPLHAFDLAKLHGARIVVRRAKSGEMLRTLDGVERKLDPSILVIADKDRAVALAGIMGGDETAVRDTTQDLLLESAWFAPSLVRAGRKKLGMSTDASYRFEREADIEAAEWAAERAAALFVEIAGGTVREAMFDAYIYQREPLRLALRVERCNQLVGTELTAGDMAALLERLQIPARAEGAGRVEVTVPSFRRDLRAEIDLVEEVARVHGYERIPSEVVPPAPLLHRDNPRWSLVRRLRQEALGLGYLEARTSAFMDQRDPERLQLAADDPRRRAVRIANPLVSQLDTMRTSLIPGLLRVLRHNRNHDQDQLRFAQVDRVFLDVPGPHPGLPTEIEKLVCVASGSAAPPGWGEKERPVDVHDLKGDAEALFAVLGVDTRWTYGYTEPFLEEAVSFVISSSYGEIARGGSIRGEVLAGFDVEPPVVVLEVDLDALEASLPRSRRYRETPRFPAVKRDLSLAIPPGVTWQAIEATVRGVAGPRLESLVCFDVFDKGGTRSLGLRLRFRDPSRTLTEADVGPMIDSIVRALADGLHVTLRAGG